MGQAFTALAQVAGYNFEAGIEKKNIHIEMNTDLEIGTLFYFNFLQ